MPSQKKKKKKKVLADSGIACGKKAGSPLQANVAGPALVLAASQIRTCLHSSIMQLDEAARAPGHSIGATSE